jgi:alpha-glucuronidase
MTRMRWQAASVIPVWLIALAGAIVIGIVSPRAEYFTWLGVVAAVAVIATFALQLATRRPEGFVVRAMASIGVSVVILAAATGVTLLFG